MRRNLSGGFFDGWVVVVDRVPSRCPVRHTWTGEVLGTHPSVVGGSL